MKNFKERYGKIWDALFRNLSLLILVKALFLLVCVLFRVNNAVALEVAPLVGAWDYAYIRCDTYHRGNPDEHQAALSAADYYYNRCSDPVIVWKSGWGTLENPNFGACGSTLPFPRAVFDYSLGIEARNVQHFSVSYCRSENNPDGFVDGFVLSRQRTVECPQGSIQSGRLCFADIVPEKNMDDTCIGNPISFSIGNKFEKVTDYQDTMFSGLKVQRTYHSLLGGWSFAFNANLLIGSNERIYALRPDGKTLVFRNVDGIWRGDEDIFDTISAAPEGGSDYSWRYNTVGGEAEFYDESGILVLRRDSERNEFIYEYSQYGKLTSIRNDRSRSLEFYYDEYGRVKEIKTGDEEAILYEYDEHGNISEVLNKNGSDVYLIYNYVYEDERYSGALTGVFDADGNRFATWAYDEQGRAYLSEHTGGVERTVIDYSSLDNEAQSSVTITNALGKKATYYFEAVQGVRKVIKVEGHASSNCAAANKSYEYYDNGTLKSKTDWEGRVTTFLRDDFGREISRTEAAGTAEERTVTTEYHSELNKPVKITEPGLVTEMTYDAAGRLLSNKKTSTTVH